MNAHTHHRLEIEPLESRRLLAVILTLTGDHEAVDLPSTNLSNVAEVDICGCGDNVVTLNAQWIRESGMDGAVKVVSDPGDRVEVTDTGWKFTSVRAEGEEFVRQFNNEDAILDLVGPDDFTNPLNAEDINGSGEVSLLDALAGLNELRAREFSHRDDGSIRDVSEMPLSHFNFYDVSGNHRITALDVLCVINRLKENADAEKAVGEKTADPVAPLRLLTSDPAIEEQAFLSQTSVSLDLTEAELSDPSVALVTNDVSVPRIEGEQQPVAQSSEDPTSSLTGSLVDSAVLDPTLELCLELDQCLG